MTKQGGLFLGAYERIVLSLTLLFWSFAAVAAGGMDSQTLVDSANSTKDSTNSAMGMSIKLFGSVMTDPMGMNADTTMLGSIFGVINGSLMVIGTVWVSYSIISGTLMTAHEGEFLGKSMSSVWLPVRMVAGMGSLVPIKSGYCLAQFVMMAAIQLGIGLGNLSWNAVVDRTASGNALITAHAINGKSVALQVFNSNICMEALNSGADLMSAAHKAGFRRYAMSTITRADGSIVYNYGSVMPSGTKKECGSFETPAVINHKSNGLSTQQGKTYSAFVGTNDAIYNTAEAAATALYAKEFEIMNRSIHEVATEYSASWVKFLSDANQPLPKYDVAKIDAAAATYQSNIENGVLKIQVTLNNSSKSGNFIAALKEDAAQNGFINAGAWYMTIGTANSIAQDAMSKSVKITSSPLLPSDSSFEGLGTYYAKISDGASAMLRDSKNAEISQGASDNGGDGDGIFWSTLKRFICESKSSSLTSSGAGGTNSSLGQCIIEGVISSESASAPPAIVKISSMGNSVTALGAGIITTIGAVEGGKKAVREAADKSLIGEAANALGLSAPARIGIGTAEGILDRWLGVAFVAAETLFFWGIIASVWIPMIPAVIWIGGVASLLAVWVEAVVAAPLWAFAHLDTDGEGMGQRSQTGYLFLLNVLFRPGLMVVGFILGSIMVEILTDYVTALYPSIIANANVDSWTGLIKIVAYLAAFVIILQTVVSISFSMIRFVPDQVLGWIGGNQTNQIGAQAEDVAGRSAAGAFAMRGSVGEGPMAKAKQAKQADASRAKQDRANDSQVGANQSAEALSKAQLAQMSGASGDGGNMAGIEGIKADKGAPR